MSHNIQISIFESLSTDLLVEIIDHLDLETKALLARCSKTLLDLIGIQIFHELSKSRDARCKYFLQLEKDLPTDQFFCPGCSQLHSTSQVEKWKRSHYENYSANPPCVRQDLRSEISEFYGQDFNFFQARFAMSLYRRRDPRASQCLRELEGTQRLGRSDRNSYQFYRRNFKIVNIPPSCLPQLFLRLEHWCVITDKMVTKKNIEEWPRFSVRVCYHRIDPYLGSRPSIQEPFSLGLSMIRNVRQSLSSPQGQHSHTTLHHCSTCGVDYRMDVINLPNAPNSPQSSLLHRRSPHWGIVVTKWLNLGTLDAQDSEWQAHVWTSSGQKMNYTTPKPTPGSLVQIFETGQVTGTDIQGAEYRPQWSKGLEGDIKAAWDYR